MGSIVRALAKNARTGHPRFHFRKESQNLVKGPVTRLGAGFAWRWSSFRFYSLGETGRVVVNEGSAKISFREWAA